MTGTQRLRELLRAERVAAISTVRLQELAAEAGLRSLDYAQHVAAGERISVHTTLRGPK